MIWKLRLRPEAGAVRLTALLIAAAAGVLFFGDPATPEVPSASEAALRDPGGSPRLISVVPLPAMDGPMCEWVPASAANTLWAALQQERPVGQGATQARRQMWQSNWEEWPSPGGRLGQFRWGTSQAQDFHR